MVHPSFLDQPFVKVPNHYPNEDIDFSAGDVVYENPHAGEWSKLSMMCWYQAGLLYFVINPIATLFATRIPSAEAISYNNYDYWDVMYTMGDSVGLGSTVVSLVAIMCLHFSTRYFYSIASCFPRKVQFSKHRDLLFISTIGPSGADTESTIEMANLEHLPVSVMSDKSFSGMKKNGFYSMKCLKTGVHYYCNSLLFYYFCDLGI